MIFQICDGCGGGATPLPGSTLCAACTPTKETLLAKLLEAARLVAEEFGEDPTTETHGQAYALRELRDALALAGKVQA